tara:strand:- start:89 stop:253 length:165 start_codon:yes stop_codon:yes gene_type:complete
MDFRPILNMDFEFNIIILFPKSLLFGIGYMEEEEGFEYQEINLFFGIVQIQIRW